ncbi:MAG: acetylxylan esterase, partial [Vicinamibacterales bacterium]
MQILFHRAVIALFLSVGVAQAQTLQVTTDRSEAIYHRNEWVAFRVTGSPGTAEYTISKDGFETIDAGTLTLGDKPAEVRASIEGPGVIHCDVTMNSTATTKPLKATGGAAIDPREIRPSLPPPDDFDAFWAAQKKLVADEPAKPVLTPVKSPDDAIDTLDVQINCPGGAPVSGYLAIPKNAKPKSLPAILYPHSAGVRSSDLPHALHGATLGLIALDINAHGIPNGKSDDFYRDLANSDLKGYPGKGVTADRQTVYFRGMYLRLIRAL